MKYLIYLNFIFMLISISCKDELIGPPPEPPGRRDYVWSADTIDNYYGNRIFGTSASNLRLFSSNIVQNYICKYDGKSWTKEELPKKFNPSCIFGYNNQLWAGSLNGGLWQLKGTWQKSPAPDQFFINDIWGVDENSLYAVGSENLNCGCSKGLLLKLKGSSWEKLNIPEIRFTFTKIRKDHYENCFYLLANGFDSTGYNKNVVYRYDEKGLSKIYDEAISTFTVIDFNEHKGKVLFSIGNLIAAYSKDRFITILEVKHPLYLGKMFGKSEKDILLNMNNAIGHYNGIDIKYIFHNQISFYIDDFINFGQEIIFLDAIDNKSVVVKGVLN